MGRKNYATQAPQRPRAWQRSALPANQELCRAIKGPRVKSFGIRRLLTEESTEKVLFPVQLMENDGMLPRGSEVRKKAHVTMLPRRKLDRQLRQGLVAGYEFGKSSARIRKEITPSAPPRPIPAVLGEIALFKGGNLGAYIESDELDYELGLISDLLGRIGLKGGIEEPLHVSLITLDGRVRKSEREAVEADLAEVFPLGEEILVQPPMFYPE